MIQRSLTLLACALLTLPATAQPRPTHVVIGLAIPPTVTDGGAMAAADELGLFAAEGIEPEYVVFQGAGAMLPQIAQKKVLIGLPLTEPVLASYDTGNAPLPVQFFYNANPYNGLELAVLESGPVKTIADLRGKAVGVGALTWGTIPQTRSLLREAGLAPGSDVDIVPVGVLGSGFQALKMGRVAALNYNETWTRLLEAEGTKLRRLPMPEVYERMVANAYVAHADTVRDQAVLLAGFGRVVTKANLVCEANPRFCVEAFWRSHPEARPKEGDPTQNLAQAIDLMQMRSRRALHLPDGAPRVPGAFDLDIIHAYVKALQHGGELKTDTIPVDRLFNNALVPEFAKFDHAALLAKAQALN